MLIILAILVVVIAPIQIVVACFQHHCLELFAQQLVCGTEHIIHVGGLCPLRLNSLRPLLEKRDAEALRNPRRLGKTYSWGLGFRAALSGARLCMMHLGRTILGWRITLSIDILGDVTVAARAARVHQAGSGTRRLRGAGGLACRRVAKIFHLILPRY